MNLAFGDESGSVASLDPGAYLMMAVLVPEAQVDELRLRMQTLLLKGQRKLHWRDERKV